MGVQAWPAPLGACVSEWVGLRASASRSARRLAQERRALGHLRPYAALGTALPAQSGVGRFTAIRFISEVGDVHRFATADSLPNYLGRTPREYSSGENVHRGRIRKCGPGSVRVVGAVCVGGRADGKGYRLGGVFHTAGAEQSTSGHSQTASAR